MLLFKKLYLPCSSLVTPPRACYMKRNLSLSIIICLLAITGNSLAQQPRFNKIIDDKINPSNLIADLTHDRLGYIWFATENALKRYDGKEIISFRHDPSNPNSIASNDIASLSCDSSGNIWIGFYGAGADCYNLSANTFTHYMPGGKSSDTIISIITDRPGTVWLGSDKALYRFDKALNKFTAFYPAGPVKQGGVTTPVTVIYEDKAGTIWLGTGNPFEENNTPEYGLYSLNRATGKFTHYANKYNDTTSLINNNITAIYEDSKGNFWVGTQGCGLHIMNRGKGTFKRYPYGIRPGGISGQPPAKKNNANGITFITEDTKGKIWIGSIYSGITCYSPADGLVTHYGADIKPGKQSGDILNGFTDYGAFRYTMASDGLMFIAGFSGNIYLVSYTKTSLPFTNTGTVVNSFYQQGANTLWLGTNTGLVSMNMITGERKVWQHNAGDNNSLSNNYVVSVRADKSGNLWLATHGGGLEEFNIPSGRFTHYKTDNTNITGQSIDSLHYIFTEGDRYLWLGTENGLARMDRAAKTFTSYTYREGDTASISPGPVYSIAKDRQNNIWAASFAGAERLDATTGKVHHYLSGYVVTCFYTDHTGTLWAGCQQGLFSYNPVKDNFTLFTMPGLPDGVESIMNIQEDNDGNFWITTSNFVYKINSRRNQYKRYNASFGPSSLDMWVDNYKAADGRLFIGNAKGYFSFNPKDINDNWVPPLLNFTGLKIGEKEVYNDDGSVLAKPIWQTESIQLAYSENTFSVDFNAIDYHTAGGIKYMFKLDGADDNWHNIGTDHRASFFNMPYGHYTLYVRATTAEGTISEKSIVIDIARPWYKTWWAYTLYILFGAIGVWGLYKYQQQRIIKKEREKAKEQELLHAKEIEKAYTELKATQAQLVQAEKMASLGELTAGIAHEIQNPLNFVNNFSEVSGELVEELEGERLKVESERDKELEDEILADIKQNLQKINQHGKRADAIIKGMLQHSRTSTGQKQPTDINALVDEFLRLSYHGVRAKDNKFNAALSTNFGELPKANIVPQDVGRVLLNIFNNAFYAVSERKKLQQEGYSPTVTVSTSIVDDKVQVLITDNGTGIPADIVSKIFQPFFTTKPTGKGTGLGLSLSYDIIVKGHGGALEVCSIPNELTEFIITLPVGK